MRSSFFLAGAGALTVVMLFGGCSTNIEPPASIPAAATPPPGEETPPPGEEPAQPEVADATQGDVAGVIEVGPPHDWYSSEQSTTPVYLDDYLLLTYDLIEQYGMPCESAPYSDAPNLGEATYTYNYFTDAGALEYAQKPYPDCGYIPLDTVTPGNHIALAVGLFASNEDALAYMRTSFSGDESDPDGVICQAPSGVLAAMQNCP